MDDLQIELTSYNEILPNAEYDFDRIIYGLDSQIDLLSSQADKFDYLVSIGSGVLCGLLDIIWVGDFSLERGRGIASDKIDGLVKKTAKLLGCKGDDLESAVKFLEKKFPIPSDGNINDFGGGRQHHLRDFAHHPTIVGLIFSLLTQFTCKSYGTKQSFHRKRCAVQNTIRNNNMVLSSCERRGWFKRFYYEEWRYRDTGSASRLGKRDVRPSIL